MIGLEYLAVRCVSTGGGYLKIMFEKMDRGVYATDMLKIVYVAIH
jgi:hypothetical protein